MIEPEATPFPPTNFREPSDLPDLAELQLQQELRNIFEVDTQRDLQAYLNSVQNFQPQSWTTDIQNLYRSIHTIKGGAVTVGADAILYVASALEDLLSDLRYLDAVPLLDDGQLSQILLEAGELLASAISLQEVGDNALAVVQPKIVRLQALREQIQTNYLPEWSEQAQLQREFAEDGFDLVVLDLEMALAQLPDRGAIPEETLSLVQETLETLEQIGEELQLASAWTELLQEAQGLLAEEGASLRSQWSTYLEDLKACAKRGGKALLSSPEVGERLDELVAPEELLIEKTLAPLSIHPGRSQEPVIGTPPCKGGSGAALHSPCDGELRTGCDDRPAAVNQAQEAIQIPVPLERLERSTQHLVDTLLTARATQGSYQTLRHQLFQLVALAQESVQHITQLRQLQDDYALLDNLKAGDVQGLTPERYRRGYTTINRLLENSLRLSELGAETEQTTREAALRLERLDRHVLSLRDTIESSRLIPFQNFGFRARAILRDLTNRYGKPAQLIIQGESIELDVGTIRVLEPALIHLIRNAYDHGLEPPAERIVRGKSEQGTLTLALSRRGSNFLLTCQDDGRGINAQAIQARAKALGLPLTNTQTPAALLAVLCQPGFSAQTQVTELSGRGVGMDVVAAQLARLGGQLGLETSSGIGTLFSLKFPVPHLLVPCLLLSSSGQTFAIPLEHVVSIALLGQLDASQLNDVRYCYDWEIRQGNTVTPGLDLLTYWFPHSRPSLLADTSICVYVRSQEDRSGVWLLADKLLEQSELLIKPLPSPLFSPNGLMGVSLQPEGTLIPVLEVGDLIEQLLTAEGSHSQVAPPPGFASPEEDGRPRAAAPPFQGGERVTSPTQTLSQLPASLARTSSLDTSLSEQSVQQTAPRILVVDDAALMRRRIGASLSASGYAIDTCADGLEAWNWLQNHPNPDLIITDIEMPNMDGFTLIDRCRKAGKLFPIIVISSRLAEEWGREAQRLGATEFLTKGFSTTELLNQINLCLSAKQY